MQSFHGSSNNEGAQLTENASCSIGYDKKEEPTKTQTQPKTPTQTRRQIYPDIWVKRSETHAIKQPYTQTFSSRNSFPSQVSKVFAESWIVVYSTLMTSPTSLLSICWCNALEGCRQGDPSPAARNHCLLVENSQPYSSRARSIEEYPDSIHILLNPVPNSPAIATP